MAVECVPAAGVLGDLLLDLGVEINTVHLGQREHLEDHVGQLFAEIGLGSAPTLVRFLNATDWIGTVEWDVATARAVGVLCGKVGTSEVVDVSVALCVCERDDHVVTSDPQDFAVRDPQLPVIIV